MEICSEMKTRNISLPRYNLFFNSYYSLIFELFMFIGVNFNEKDSLKFKQYCKSFLSIVWHLFTVYYLTLSTYYIGFLGLYENELLVSLLPIFNAFIIRLIFLVKKSYIFKSCKLLVSSQSAFNDKSQKSTKMIILLIFGFIVLMAVIASFIPYVSGKAYNLRNENLRFQLFGSHPSNIYFQILAEALSIMRHWLGLAVPCLTLVMLCIVYKELENIISSAKSKLVLIITNNSVSSSKLEEFISHICKVAAIVQNIDSTFSCLLFCLISTFMLQIMVLISIAFGSFTKDLPVSSILIGGTLIISALITVVVFASLIPERFSEIKILIATSSSLRKEVFSKKSQDISFIVLSNIMNELTPVFYMSALGTVKIDKSVIITILCALLSYGVIFYQFIET